MKPTLAIGGLTLNLPVRRPEPARRSKRRKDVEPENMHVEIHDTYCQIWTDYECGETYTYDAGQADGRKYVSQGIAAMPFLDEVYRLLAEQRAAHRGDPIGPFLDPMLAAMESAIAARDGASIYFADAGGQIKIGWSRKVSARLAQLQVGCASPLKLLGTMPGGLAVERRIHERFAHLRLSGEWFTAAPELLAYIAEGRTTAEHQARLASGETT
jgi:hypothetical protein